jgi:hypothetical protein
MMNTVQYLIELDECRIILQTFRKMRQIREIVFNKTEEEKSFSNQFLKMKKQYLMKS